MNEREKWIFNSIPITHENLFPLQKDIFFILSNNGIPTLIWLCSAGHAGKEFATVFMQNYETTAADPRFELQISAYFPSTKIKVTVPGTSFSQNFDVAPGQGVIVSLPKNIELLQTKKYFNTVLVQSTQDITVQSFNSKHLSADTAIIYPVSEWGTDYYAFTPEGSPPNYYKEIAITNYNVPNVVEVFLKGTVRFEGRTYVAGSRLRIELKAYESVQLQSVHSLSGTRIRSNSPVAVLSGHMCTWKNTKCNHVYEQLLPVPKWGSNFIIPPLAFQTKVDYAYILASEPTKITIESGGTRESIILMQERLYQVDVKFPNAVIISANRGIQVMFLSSGGYIGNVPFDPFLMNIADTGSFCNSFTLQGQNNFRNSAIIVARVSARAEIRLDGNLLQSDITWRAIGGSEYSWAEVDYSSRSGRHTFSHLNSNFIVYGVGTSEMNGYDARNRATLISPDHLICISLDHGRKLDCIRNVPGTCWAMGDPHYRTFDGRTFDFMGTCTYTIAKTCHGETSLPTFEIGAKNENRGNLRVSYVGMVTIKVYDYTITVVHSERGRIRVREINYMLWYLPVYLDGGKIQIYQSGPSVIVETDFGLKVHYDWDHYLVITLSSTYEGKVCGLCGNFNGKINDDFTTPSGTLAPNAIDFCSSWKISGGVGGELCWDNCNGECQRCEDSFWKRFEGELFCGLITRIIDGPFRMCHSIIDPKVYLDNCVYDVCINGGYRHFLCQSLQVYSDVCQRAGIVVYDWRIVANCPASCPENSHYEHCGNACPATCLDPSAPSKCTSYCVGGCQCNAGYVLSAGKCVPASSCGCNYNGRHIPTGEKFWGDNTCQQRCYCNPTTNKVECKNQGCKSGEQCKVVDGITGCHPITYKTCSASGDPHYLTFDGRRYDFMGTCVYQLVGVCSKDPDLVPFEVEVQNDYRGSKVVSYTKLVLVKVYNEVIVMSTEHPRQVMVNGELTNLPVYLSNFQVVVYLSGNTGVIETNFNLKVTFDFSSVVSVTLPSTYSGAVCGLCGNYNSKNEDDMVMKNGRLASNPTEFGQSWRVAEIPGCVEGCKGTCPDCDITQKVQYETNSYCGIIKDPSGPFRDCHAKVNPAGYFENCVYDVCLYKGVKSVLCQAITAYTSACQQAGAKIYPWRKDTFCPLTCTKNSHYEVCVNGCPATCHDLNSPVGCKALCQEGCSCNDGFILSGDSCVPISECGCLYKERYYKLGEVFFPSGLCQDQCTCQQNGKVDCKKFSCGANEECKVEGGVRKCHPKGKGVCSASGDPHYISFDGLKFDFQGTCTYTLAKSCQIEGNPALQSFSVDVENVKYGNGKVSVTKMVAVKVFGNTLILKNGQPGLVMINDIWFNLPVELGNVRAYQNGVNVIIETNFGLIVTYDLVYHVTVTVPGNYRDKMCGLCGNFNGEKKDDFKLPTGSLAPNAQVFGGAWKINIPEVVCDNGCSEGNCPVCSTDRQAIFKDLNYCGLIISSTGPLAACFAVINPESYFSDCVYDVCMSNGDLNIVCNSIQAYVTDCQQAGVNIQNWRTPSFCPMKCPANSHYQLCAQSCSTSCAAISGISWCPVVCVEGCACDDGYFFNGEKCVLIENCGCFYNGKYFKSGEVVITENCQEKCVCDFLTGMVCEAYTCVEGTKCGIKDGVMSCRSTDPCKDVKCRPKEKCKVQKDVAVCEPEYTGTCWAWGDPHYHTFDGYYFDFQGTCTYTITETCGDIEGLVPFSVTEKNDNRGSTVVSFVRTVTIKVYDYTIVMQKQQIGKITVNNELLNLPVTLDDGKIKLFQSGGDAVVLTDFGLRVSYDWNWYLLINLPSSYYNSVCGLCGNFNGNLKDELREKDGNVVSSVIEWAKTWRVNDRDPFCWDFCQTNCPVCYENMRNIYESEQYCGKLTTKVEGIFQQCHLKVNPDKFFDSCVYDVCLYSGAKKLLCQAFNAYAEACLKEGIVIKDWRKLADCPMDCPANSHYESCASPCSVTCPFAEINPVCEKGCVEACVCNDGYALSGGKCVPKTSCGCSYQGRYYEPNEKFWADDFCHVSCTCDPKLGMVICKESSCKSTEQCKVVDGVKGCYPISYSSCTASGDLHYKTFDGHTFEFHGTCVYQLVGLCTKDGLTPFDIEVKNSNRGNSAVASTTELIVKVLTCHCLLFQVDGQFVALPFYYNDYNLIMFYSGFGVILTTGFNLQLTFTWNNEITVTLPSSYSGAVCGLCGNYNQKSADDMLMPGGKPASSIVKFGDSWKVADSPGCSSECSGPLCHFCSDSEKNVYKAEHYCGIIANKAGPFRECIPKIDPTPFLENCAYDACNQKGHHSTLCKAVAAYVSACQNAGITVHPWRSNSFCPVSCPRNSHYEICTTGCPTTCFGMSAPEKCHPGCKEGCQCDNGFILSGDLCVPISECGCVYEGEYHKKCDVFYPKGECKEECKCDEKGGAVCKKVSCGANEKCSVVNGKRGCHPIGEGKCVVSGNIHYISFDGIRFDFQGTCSYTLTKVCSGDAGLKYFSVNVENEQFGPVAITKAVTVMVYGYSITIQQGMQWEVMVDDELYLLPLSLNGKRITIKQLGSGILIQTNFGLKVLYDTNSYVDVTIPGNYRNKMCGLCGNFNGNPKDELLLPTGVIASDAEAFALGWKLDLPWVKCSGGCGKSCPVCDQSKRALYMKESSCGIIKLTNGPFQDCQSKVNPEPFFLNCIYDVCAFEGDKSILCSSIQAYAIACQAAGVKIKPWRSASFCPVSCPANSHYQQCTDTCSTCADLDVPVMCNDLCFEGCQCDAGYAASGSKCVPMESCGCMFEDIYMQVSTAITVTDGCSRKCTCLASGGVSCENLQCQASEVCGTQNGKRGCQPKDGKCENEICVMKDGFPSCINNVPGTCWAMGDPHYHTFDGRTFDFMGTCTYTIAKTCHGETSLPTFQVEAKNENRGNMHVSYVGMVIIKVYDYTITAVQSEKGRIRINFMLRYLPVNLDDSKIQIYQSGPSVFVETDFGLKVHYDWDHYLVITLSSTYKGKVCGLCGNFNGNPNDDFTTPSGTLAPNAIDFSSSWKVTGVVGGELCWDNCNGECLRCEENLKKGFESELFCGLITKVNDGPFRMCHSIVDPKVYLDNCVYDVCIHGGYQHFLCQSLQVYSDVCQRAGIVVHDWRSMVNCSASCPENSHYENCGNACPATCLDSDAPSKCKSYCIGGCQCNAGYVLSAEKCVPVRSCGCNYNGQHIPTGEKFWGDNTCQQRCYCNPTTNKVECKNQGCKSGEQCKVVDGVSGCHPTNYKTCSASGDPHYLTFDGRRYDFMGTCVYQLVGVCSNDPDLVPFEVDVQNDHRGHTVVSYTKLVLVKVYDEVIVMSTVHPKQVNDELLNLPVYRSNNRVMMYLSGNIGVIETNFNLKVTFDFSSVVRVTLPSSYSGAVCGLCGNYNSKNEDDMVMKNGRLASNPTEFGQSWRVADIPGCVEGCKGTCPNCDITEKVQYETDSYCGIIKDPSGPFRDCHAKVNPAGYFENCVYDVCLYKGVKSVLCQAIIAYTSACQHAGATIYPWRKDTFCPLTCPKNSHYEVCADGCPATCHGLNSPVGCKALCQEGCSCNDGFILSGDCCVPISKCGCLYNEKYYKLGEVFFPSGLCQDQCTCQQNGKVDCKKFSCGANEECKVEGGVRKCHPKGKGVCSVSGGSHYISFDGLKFDVQGTCTYTLTKSCHIEGNPALQSFSVDLENEMYGNGKVSVTKMVAVQVFGNTLILKNNRPGLMINDIWFNLPVKVGNVRAYQNGVNVIIETDFGLIVTYDLVYHVTVTVPGNYRDKMCGLCGNFNIEKKDDFKLPTGSLASNARVFGGAWKINIPDVVCDDGCSEGNCPVCSTDKQAIFKDLNYCGLIISSTGPLDACFAVINPESYFSDCVSDMCMSNGDLNIVCNSVQAYVTDCQQAGVNIQKWRTPSFCSIKCPANSHYELCAQSCDTSCAAVSGISWCPAVCVEGCACDDGYFFNGEKCVLIENCGCFYNDKYFKSGEVVITENCQKQCVCDFHRGMICEAYTCAEGTKCGIKDGVMSCRSTDPCKDVKCRPKEKCKVQKDIAVCEPQYTGTCWAWGDPHYRSFDGYYFDFQGTCTYTITETCGDIEGLVPFSVTEKNDNRGSTAVSFVRTVTIKVYGYTIVIQKQQIGKIMVNNELLNLPVTLDDGKIKLFQSGNDAVVLTNFGLRISYDWNWYLLINLPSSYYNSVCGLCGDFNGNIEDEQRGKDGKLVSSVIDWAKSWKVNDRDPFCWDYCQTNCPVCEENMRNIYESEQYCGKLTMKTEGIFEQCHVKVDPDKFFDSCVYDVCLYSGAKKLLCQAFSAYAEACLKEGIVIKDWRKLADCPMDCPENSHYESCASPCPVTCPFTEKVSVCEKSCVDACVCNNGYALSGGKCVPNTSCGCSYQGRYYEPNEKFWADDFCNVSCTCDPKLGMVICKESGCKSNEQCKVVDGVKGCYPLGYSSCTATGELHYKTFDGYTFEFHGTCVYQLVRLCTKDGLTPFDIEVKNSNRGNSAVASTSELIMKVYGIDIVISMNYPFKVMVDGEFVALPFYYNDNNLIMFYSGFGVTLTTGFNLQLTFTWNNEITVTLPSSYSGAVCGLCGNYNQKSADDMLMPGGKPAPSIVKFGDSWKVAESPGCSSECSDPLCHFCSDSEKNVYKAEHYCGIIANKAGPFRECIPKIDPTPFLENCAYDACNQKGHHSTLCKAVTAYVSACQNAGLTVYPWRSNSFCPVSCPKNSHYEICTTGCPTTCFGLSAPEKCQPGCKEGCQCDSGFILSGALCVHISECGCVYEGEYHKKCDVFYPKGECKEECKCNEKGGAVCKKVSCGANEKCSVVNGKHGCHPVGEGKCVVSGNIHYISFDGIRFDFQGTCSYTLTKVCSGEAGLKYFSLNVENEQFGPVAITKAVTVDNELHQLPLSLNGKRITIKQLGSGILIQTDFGLKVLYDTKSYVDVTIPGNYRNKMCGLCGNFNGNPKDELLLPTGVIASDAEAFALGWKLDLPWVKCSGGCGKSCPVCDQSKRALYMEESSCGIFKLTNGPFQDCQSKVNPMPFFLNCIYDVCAFEGDKSILCSSIQAYAIACQAAGVKIKPWRSASFCPVSCPANSHYQQCTDTCSTCADLNVPVMCTDRCFEGCQCDAGYAASGSKCVPMESCGCMFEDIYMQVSTLIVSNDCSRKCTCLASGAVSCEKLVCQASEVCETRNGKRGCQLTEGKCEVKSKGLLTSFDGLQVQFGNGAFEIAYLCDEKSVDWFRVVVDVRICNKDTNQSMFLHIFLQVNGKRINLPAKLQNEVSVSISDKVMIIARESVARVTYSITEEVSVTVSEQFSGKMCGACGNFNGNSKDDMTTSGGEISINIKEVVDSWRSKDISSW
uniref:IgGFc-binding protein-like n=1 Tax=Erpetoichthys calabaricus TaxID=27687 RepID=A0A8C4T5G8_ERPCA